MEIRQGTTERAAYVFDELLTQVARAGASSGLLERARAQFNLGGFKAGTDVVGHLLPRETDLDYMRRLKVQFDGELRAARARDRAYEERLRAAARARAQQDETELRAGRIFTFSAYRDLDRILHENWNKECTITGHVCYDAMTHDTRIDRLVLRNTGDVNSGTVYWQDTWQGCVVLHSHPSGCLTPSGPDRELGDKCRERGIACVILDGHGERAYVYEWGNLIPRRESDYPSEADLDAAACEQQREARRKDSDNSIIQPL